MGDTIDEFDDTVYHERQFRHRTWRRERFVTELTAVGGENAPLSLGDSHRTPGHCIAERGDLLLSRRESTFLHERGTAKAWQEWER
jgi:hypothetical protein